MTLDRRATLQVISWSTDGDQLQDYGSFKGREPSDLHEAQHASRQRLPHKDPCCECAVPLQPLSAF